MNVCEMFDLAFYLSPPINNDGKTGDAYWAAWNKQLPEETIRNTIKDVLPNSIQDVIYEKISWYTSPWNRNIVLVYSTP